MARRGVATLDVTMERIAQMAGGHPVGARALPRRGGERPALLAGQINVSAEASGWAEMVLVGRCRLLATWGEERPRRFSMAPTLRQAGIDIVNSSPYGLAGPKGWTRRWCGCCTTRCGTRCRTRPIWQCWSASTCR
jgi:tripartite-type tricarboxylate transporter receptor subunit TctC